MMEKKSLLNFPSIYNVKLSIDLQSYGESPSEKFLLDMSGVKRRVVPAHLYVHQLPIHNKSVRSRTMAI